MSQKADQGGQAAEGDKLVTKKDVTIDISTGAELSAADLADLAGGTGGDPYPTGFNFGRQKVDLVGLYKIDPVPPGEYDITAARSNVGPKDSQQ